MLSILAIDQGTHASKAVLYDDRGRKLFQSVLPIAIHHINEVTVEQNAEEILLSVQQVIANVLAHPVVVTAASLATQRSTLVAWDRETGRALAPAISWMDRRCAPWLKSLSKSKHIIQKHTGLLLSPHYLGGKMRWLLDHTLEVKTAHHNQTLMLGSLSSFLCFRLLREQACVIDHSHALRSLLCDLNTLNWHPDLLALFQIDATILPRCVPTQSTFGHLYQQSIALNSVCGDQNAALYARGQLQRHSVVINLGSGAFMLHACGPKPLMHEQLISSIARSQGAQAEYLLEGTVNGAGLALSWLQKQYPDIDLIAGLPTWLQTIQSPPCFLNAIGGLGSPWWTELESRFIPSTELGPVQKAVAIIESIVFLLQHNLSTLVERELNVIYISGGLSQLDGMCQKLADLSGLAVLRYEDPEATARGAAWLVSDNVEEWNDQVKYDTFEPKNNPALLDRYRTMTNILNELKE